MYLLIPGASQDGDRICMIMIPAPVYHARSALVSHSRHPLLLSCKVAFNCAVILLCSSLAISHRPLLQDPIPDPSHRLIPDLSLSPNFIWKPYCSLCDPSSSPLSLLSLWNPFSPLTTMNCRQMVFCLIHDVLCALCSVLCAPSS